MTTLLSSPCALIGDFNKILNIEKKKYGAPVGMNGCLKFKKWVEKCGLIDLGVLGFNFT